MTIFNPTEYPPDEVSIVNSGNGIKINTLFSNSATAITLSSVLTGTSPTIAYKVSATLKQNG